MKKKKKPGARKPPPEEDAVDELEALAAIYGDAFQLAADGSSFSVRVKALDGGSGAAQDERTPCALLVRSALRPCGLRACCLSSC